MASAASDKMLFRSRDAFIGGVCAGLADYFNTDVLVMRVLAVLLLLVSVGLAGVVYLVLWAHLPLAPTRKLPYDIAPVQDEYGTYANYLVANSEGEDEWIKLPIRGLSWIARLAIVLAMLALAVLLMMVMSVILPFAPWWNFWPVIPFEAGIFFTIVPIRSSHRVAWHTAGIMVVIASFCLLPVCVGVIAPQTVAFAFEMLWPIFFVAVVLFVLGVFHEMNGLVVGGAFCFVLFCLTGGFFCLLPGPNAIGSLLSIILA